MVAACGSDNTTTVPEPAAATTTAATTQPAAPETTASVQEPAVDVETGTTVETDELPSTTTVSVVVSSEAVADEEDPADAAQEVPEQEPCPEGEHGHDGECHDDEPAPEPETITAAPTTTAAPAVVTPTTTAAPEPVVATTTTVPEVFCPEGQVHMPEFTTETDPGCRVEVCDNGRTSDGWCRGPDYVEVENTEDDPGEPAEPSTDPNDHPCQRQDDSADGLLGICTHDGVRYCFDHEWLLCPGGGGEPCPATSGPLAFRGRGGLNSVSNIVPLTAGRWRADICLWDSPYGPSLFAANLLGDGFPVAQVNGEWEWVLVYVGGPADNEPGVAKGRWTVEFEIPVIVAHRTKQMWVTAAAGGEWTVVFTRLEDTDDTG